MPESLASHDASNKFLPRPGRLRAARICLITWQEPSAFCCTTVAKLGWLSAGSNGAERIRPCDEVKAFEALGSDLASNPETAAPFRVLMPGLERTTTSYRRRWQAIAEVALKENGSFNLDSRAISVTSLGAENLDDSALMF